MSIVTCDIVESVARGIDKLFISITTLLATTAFGASSLVLGTSAMITERAVAHEAIAYIPVGMITERGVAYETLTPQSNLNWLVVERGKAKEFVFATPVQDVIERGTGSSSMVVVRGVDLVESADGADVVLLDTETNWSIVERATAKETLFGFNDYSIVERGTGASSLLPTLHATWLITERGLASDEAMIDGDFDGVLTSTAYGSSSVFSQSVLSAMIVESATGRSRVLLTLYGQGWVMNTENFGMSRYTDMPVATLAVVAGRVFAMGDTGLYELAGDTDEGELIDASVTTGRLLLNNPAKKKVPDVFLTGTFAGEMALTVGVYGGANKGSYTYTMPKRDADSPRGQRIPLGKGLTSTYWKFRIANKSGGDFNIDTVNADVAPSTTRRI